MGLSPKTAAHYNALPGETLVSFWFLSIYFVLNWRVAAITFVQESS